MTSLHTMSFDPSQRIQQQHPLLGAGVGLARAPVPLTNYNISRAFMKTIVPEKHFALMDRIVTRMTVSDKMFYTMPFVIGIPQLILNSVVIASVILLWKTKAAGVRPGMEISAISRSHKAAFLFIANLALADVLLVVAEAVAVRIQRVTHDYSEYADDFYLDLSVAGSQMDLARSRETACKIQFGVWAFTVSYVVIASLVITVDRYIYITRGLQYAMIMTPFRTKIIMFLSWLIPGVWCFTAIVQFEQQTDAECIVGHLLPTTFTAGALGSIILVFAVIYLLYILILLKFVRSSLWRKRMVKKLMKEGEKVEQKGLFSRIYKQATTLSGGSSNRSYELSRENSRTSHASNPLDEAFENNRSQIILTSFRLTDTRTIAFEEDPTTNVIHAVNLVSHSRLHRLRSSTVLKGITSASKFTRAAKYVLLLLLSFTVAWSPWLYILYQDMVLHSSGEWREMLKDSDCASPLPGVGSMSSAAQYRPLQQLPPRQAERNISTCRLQNLAHFSHSSVFDSELELGGSKTPQS